VLKVALLYFFGKICYNIYRKNKKRKKKEMTLQDLDNGLYCMFMNKVEIMDAVVDELETDLEYYEETYDYDFAMMVRAACDNLGYDFNDLDERNIREIWERVCE